MYKLWEQMVQLLKLKACRQENSTLDPAKKKISELKYKSKKTKNKKTGRFHCGSPG